MAAAFHALATAILKSSLPVGTRNDLTSQLEFVAGQAAAPSAERNTAMVKLALDALRTALSTTADLLQLWNQWDRRSWPTSRSPRAVAALPVPLPVVPGPPPNRRSSRIAPSLSALTLVQTYAMYSLLVGVI